MSLFKRKPQTALAEGSPPATPTGPGLLDRWMTHRERMAEQTRLAAQEETQRRQEAWQTKAQAKAQRRAERRAIVRQIWQFWQQQKAARRKPISSHGLRHSIQRAGHEVLPVLFLVAASGSTLLFFLGNQYDGQPPKEIIIPIVVAIAFCIEWATATVGQDLQDAITLHDPAGVIRSTLFCLVTYGASIFMMANAASAIWAPRDSLLGLDTHTWAWVMAGFFFGVQLALKLTPERPKGARNLHMITGFITLAYPEATPEEQATIAARMLNAVAGQPAQIAAPVIVQETTAQPKASQNGHSHVAPLVMPGTLTLPKLNPTGSEGSPDDSFRA